MMMLMLFFVQRVDGNIVSSTGLTKNGCIMSTMAAAAARLSSIERCLNLFSSRK